MHNWRLSGKESTCDTGGDIGLIPGLGRSGGGNGNPLQYSCLENPMDRRAWRATVHGVTRVRHDLATKPLYCSNIIDYILTFTFQLLLLVHRYTIYLFLLLLFPLN